MSILIITILLWELYWKYNALWLAAKRSHRGWFFAILIINSVGLLPIYYLYTKGYFDDQDSSIKEFNDNKIDIS